MSGALATRLVSFGVTDREAHSTTGSGNRTRSTSITSMLILSVALHLTLLVVVGLLFTRASLHGAASGSMATGYAASLTVEIAGEPALRVRARKPGAEVAARSRPVSTEPLSSKSTNSLVAESLPPPPQAMAPPIAPAYRLASTLDQRPSPTVDIAPVYPARAGKQDGSVVLRLLIDETGQVDGIAVVRAFPAGFFEDAAVDAFRGAVFSPGKFAGVPVKSQLLVELNFEVPDRLGKDLR